MLERNVDVVVCSDDPAVFSMGEKGCILNDEFKKLYDLLINYGKTQEQALTKLVEIANRSIEKSLALSPDDKLKFKKENTDLLETILLTLSTP
jgi:hypothetical protein